MALADSTLVAFIIDNDKLDGIAIFNVGVMA